MQAHPSGVKTSSFHARKPLPKHLVGMPLALPFDMPQVCHGVYCHA
jgi:hypothetical protein